MPHPKLQPSTAQRGPPRRTAQLSTMEQMQVLSSPEVLLRRMSAFLAAARPLSAAVAAAPPLQLLDGMAGEGNYTQHLPDGMGRTPALVLWQQGWSVALSEPAPPTFAHLRANFVGGDGQGRHRAGAGAVLQQVGVTAASQLQLAQIWVLQADVPALGATPLPMVARQRLQWASSVDPSVPRHHRKDYWQIDHLAGGPLQESLRAGNTTAAKDFARCITRNGRKSACFTTRLTPYNATLLPWPALLERLGLARRHIDMLVVDVRDASVEMLLRAFPLHQVKPSLIYYRHPKGGGRASMLLREHLMSHGYATSAHWETSAWGELNLAWRTDRCGVEQRPLWWNATARTGEDDGPQPRRPGKRQKNARQRGGGFR